jgi:hypothetical protein
MLKTKPAGGAESTCWQAKLKVWWGAWWRRVEITQTNQEEKDRKMNEKRMKASVEKLSFFPQTTNTHSNGKTTPTKRKVKILS